MVISQESRVLKTIRNAKANLIFQLLTLFISFYSRKIFLDYLGAGFLGLSGTVSSILGYLNLIEFGVGTAISFNLYKPIHDKNQEKINELISLFGYYYRNIGLGVLGLGIIVSFFLPVIFKDTEFSFFIIYLLFYVSLIVSLLGYFNNYKSTIFFADQRHYLLSYYYKSAMLLKLILQIIFAFYTSNYYIFILIEFSFGILGSLILNWKTKKVYPWLISKIKIGKQKSKDYPNILKSTKQIFVHRIKDLVLGQSDQLFIYAFVSLKMVAYYGNYSTVIIRLNDILSNVFAGINASVGNLIAEGNSSKIISVFWELTNMRYLIAGFASFSIFILITPFITLWLGSEYILESRILIAFLAYFFINSTRGTIDNFINAYGLYADTWVAWTEIIVNISLTILLGYFWGIFGILMAKVFTMFPIALIWKPYYLFKSEFQVGYKSFLNNTLKYYINFIIVSVISYIIIKVIPVNPYISFGWWIMYAIITCSIFLIFYLIGSTLYLPGGKNLYFRLFVKFSKK